MALKHYDKALAAAKALVAGNPVNPAVHQLEGGVHLSLRDRSAARASFEKAVSLQPTFFAAVMSLAQLDIEDGKADSAKQRLLALLAKDPNNANSMVALASLALNQKQPAEATTWLEKANAGNPEAIAPAVQLATHYLRTNQALKALTLTRKMQSANPTDPDLLDLLGQSQLATNDLAGALETYSKLAKIAPKSPAAQMRLGSVHMQMKNPAAATEDVKRALALNPDFMPAKLAMVELAMARGDSEQVLPLARKLQKDGKAPTGFLIEGDLLMAQRKPEQAVRMYEQAFARAKTPQLLVKLAAAMNQAGKEKDAEARLTQWQKENPTDMLVPMYVAESMMGKKQYKAAIERFEALLKLTPQDPSVLNNLAFAYQQENDPRALETAERALKAAPGNPAILDTLGWMLVQRGDVGRGLPMLQQAVAQQPEATDARYHLAFALDKSGDKKAAREQLNKLLSDNKPFPQIEEAKALLKKL